MKKTYGVLVVLAICMSPRPAYAVPWWDFIMELSGPGPFQGLELQWSVACVADRSGDGVEREMTPARTAEASAWALFGSGCLLQPNIRTPRASVNFTAAFLTSTRNHLQYPLSVDSTVRLDIIEPSILVHLDPNLRRDMIAVGMGAGAMTFSGQTFAGFTRMFVEPIHVEVRPFATKSGNPWGRVLLLRANLLVVPAGFDATDFGAVPGTFHTSRDVLGSFGISLDLMKLRER